MMAEKILALAVMYGFIAMGLAMLLVLYRLLRGPSRADRVVAMDFLTILALSFTGLYTVATGQRVYLDIVIAIALIGFIATLAYARYVEWRGNTNKAGRTIKKTVKRKAP